MWTLVCANYGPNAEKHSDIEYVGKEENIA